MRGKKIMFHCVQSCPDFGITLYISLTSIPNEFLTLNWTKLPSKGVTLYNLKIKTKFPNQKL